MTAHHQPQRQERSRVMTLREWAALNSLSLATARRIIASGEGPPVMQLGERRIGIREDHNEEWQASRVRDFTPKT